MFYDSSSSHFYACINTGSSITWGEARNRALSMYNSALDCYGYLAHITSQSEQDYLYTLMDKSTQGWLGATRKVSGMSGIGIGAMVQQMKQTNLSSAKTQMVFTAHYFGATKTGTANRT